MKKKKIAVLTGGGDCPGLNAVIRAVTKKAILDHNAEVIGVEDGFEGLVDKRYRQLSYDQVSGILSLGGTILGTSNVANPYNYPVKEGQTVGFKDLSKQVIGNIKDLNIDCLVCIGGDGTLAIAYRLYQEGVPVVGIPKTIDNDIFGTDISFGFDTAVQIATEGIDRLHTTAQSHHRVMIVEVMGRRAGWIALHSGVAGGGDIILIPEIPYDINLVAERVRSRREKGKRFSIIVIAEGAKPIGGDVTIKRVVADASDPVRLGGIGFVLGEQLEQMTGLETRTVVLGHLLRGGTPTPFDRILGTELGSGAVDLIFNNKFGQMIAMQNNSFVAVSLEIAAQGSRLVSPDGSLVRSARSVGTCFGNI
ncbi:MAG: ATP-dependent 6-phosphofructokinase [Candidatus Omnitrophica bacterium]|nr:ATP-dependent 6-phosphofructokinase [Candidatus Omnitrophota bacterium]